MASSNPTDVLNRLLRLLCRSLPVYLDETLHFDADDSPGPGSRLATIAADQRALAERVAEAIAGRKGRIEPGHFPLEFTATNDLAPSYLVRRAIDYQKANIETIEACIGELADEPTLLPLAETILRDVQGHLEMLEETTREE